LSRRDKPAEIFALGAKFAIARIVLAMAFGVGIGMIMAVLFRDSSPTAAAPDAVFAGGDGIPRRSLHFLGTLLALLLAGTVQLDFLATVVWQGKWRSSLLPLMQATLDRWVPVNEAIGAEGLSLQGTVLIGLLALIGSTAWRGLGQADRGCNQLTWVTLALVGLTLVFAASGVRVTGSGLTLSLNARSLVVCLLCLLLLPQARRFEDWEMQQWLWESWRFVKQIFPLLVVGVFLVGVI